MTKKFALPRGTVDILPQDIPHWRAVEETARRLVEAYGYQEIRTPIFEDTELFARSMGQTSDVVQKQMLNLAAQKQDESGQTTLSGLSLRPEGTASIVRAYIQNSLHKIESVSKLYYFGPMFRGERPQKGRLRQFHQIGVEVLGEDTASPYLDAEVIQLMVSIVRALDIEDFVLKVNSLGTAEDKAKLAGLLRERLAPQKDNLCEHCQQRFAQNVFRVLDCKNEQCRAVVGAIKLDHSDFLSENSLSYYTTLKGVLEQADVPFEEDVRLVRGLDYYTNVVFEILIPSLGAQDAVAAGGRYNTLVQQLGGPKVDAIGFAMGIERLILAMPARTFKSKPLVYVITDSEQTLTHALPLIKQGRQYAAEKGFVLDSPYRWSKNFMKSGLRAANKRGAAVVVILGEEERQRDEVKIKNLLKQKDEISVRASIQKGAAGDWTSLWDTVKKELDEREQ